jgi:hypothetical protein
VRTTLKRLELGILVALGALAVFVVWQSARMPSGTLSLPGPGMLPMALGLLLALSTLALILLLLRSGPENETPVTLGNRQIAISFPVLVGAGLLFDRVGFVVTGSLFLFALLWMLSPLGWWRSLIASVAATLTSNYLFKSLLGISLPPFPWAA